MAIRCTVKQPCMVLKIARPTLWGFILLSNTVIGSMVQPEASPFATHAWAETPQLTSNTLIRRPTISTSSEVEKQDALLSTSALNDNSKSHESDSQLKITDSTSQTTVQETIIETPTNRQFVEENKEGEEPDNPTVNKEQNSLSEGPTTKLSTGLTTSTNLPIFASPVPQSPSPAHNVSGIVSPSVAFAKNQTTAGKPSSRKLTKRPEFNRILSPLTVSQPSTTSPSVPAPAPSPTPTPTPAPTPAPSATLTWTPNQAPNIVGYRVYRRTSLGAPYTTPIATIQGNTTTFHNTNLLSGTTYYYVVTAFDSIGNESGYSNEVSQSIF